MPIIDGQRRLREAGRIRLGAQVATKDRNGNDTTRPAKLEQFRFTSADKVSMLAIADLCGGEVRPWEGAPVGEQWELYTECKSLDVLVPPVDFAFSQWYELWSGGGCKKRCDGVTNVINDSACSCDPDERECKPTTRLSVILTAIEGIGTWRLETKGWNAAAELLGTIEILRSVQSRGAMVPARLMLVERQSKKDGKVYNYVVPVLDLQVSVAALTGGATAAQLTPGVTPIRDGRSVASISEQVDAASTPQAKPPRANAAAPLPATGIAPRPAAAVTDEHKEPPPPATPAPTGDGMTVPQSKNIARLFGKLTAKPAWEYLKERDQRIAYVADVIDRPIDSTRELSKREAMTLISALMGLAGEEEKPRQARPSNEPPQSEPDPSYADEDGSPF